MTRSRRELRALLGAATRWGHDEDEVERLRAELRAVNIEVRVREVMDGQPLLTAEQADRLCALLRGYAEPDAELRAAVDEAHASVERLTGEIRRSVRDGRPPDLTKITVT